MIHLAFYANSRNESAVYIVEMILHLRLEIKLFYGKIFSFLQELVCLKINYNLQSSFNSEY